MDMENRRCSVCGNSMVEGFLLDFYKDNQTATRWVEGKPERTFSGAIAFSDRKNYHVSSLRCDQCGYLEFFAVDSKVISIKKRNHKLCVIELPATKTAVMDTDSLRSVGDI